jgi:hypothetical protein
LAAEAEIARRGGDRVSGERLYVEAAKAEHAAFSALGADKQKTRGITAVSAAALWYKGRDYASARRFAHQCLADQNLPSFAESQLRELLQLIWSLTDAEEAGMRFLPGDVLVSLKGGDVIYGGAPLDLIVRQVASMQSVLYRTIEMLLSFPLRRRGGPVAQVQALCKPWLLQAPAGSYRFAMRMEEPRQLHLWEGQWPSVTRVASTFFEILRSAASDPESGLAVVVPDPPYREAFLSLARNLAPSDGSFERLEVREAVLSSDTAVFVRETRQLLNQALRRLKSERVPAGPEEQVPVKGVLRALHLDKDWLEVVTEDGSSVRIVDATDALDDVVGPMVNKRVLVTAIRRDAKHLYRDIELDEEPDPREPSASQTIASKSA